MRPRPTLRSIPTILFVFASVFVTARAFAAGTIVLTAGDASIARDTAAGSWTLKAGGATLTLSLAPNRDFAILSLTSASGATWINRAATDMYVRPGSVSLPFGQRGSGFTYWSVATSAAGERLRLDATFDLKSAGLRITRHYAIAAGSPTFEAWTTYSPMSGAPLLEDLNLLTLAVPAGTIRWLNGLQGSTSDAPNDNAFTLQETSLALDEHLSLGAAGRSSENVVPWFAIDGIQDEFYSAVMWSGMWSVDLVRTTDGISITSGLGTTQIAVQREFDGPHVLFGAAPGGLTDATQALRSYISAGIRGGRPFTPLVTYNTWFAYWTRFDDSTIRREMASAAAMGFELFVVDAGWYAKTGAGGPTDFTSGLGDWQADESRFPNGLEPLVEYAHSLGMKFGIWVEPERVSLALVGRNGVEERWLATEDDDYRSEDAAQICLADGGAREWTMSWLTALLDEVQPDYLKWDNNFWVNCNREGHGHGSSDGNFAHVDALYGILSELRERYPGLLIENVSGGGNRLDLGMLRYSDIGWMDDRTVPSVRVRHNVEGLGAVFPPAYLLSFLIDHEAEPLHDPVDLPLYLRSRMMSVLGLCFRSWDLGEADVGDIVREIEVYKTIRSVQSVAAAALLSRQAGTQDESPWDVLQQSTEDHEQIVLYAFQTDSAVRAVNVRPTGLLAGATYSVMSIDAGELGTATGAELMNDGIDIVESPKTAAHILIISVQ